LLSPAEKDPKGKAGTTKPANREEAMVRTSVLASLLLSLVIPSSARSAPLAKEADLEGVRLAYVEQGSGEPIVFVGGGLSDLRTWEPVREEIAKRDDEGKAYRYIAYTQRYYGTGRWPDDGKNFSVATHADDLGKLIASVAGGPVHLVGYSYGGLVATTAALKNPALVRSLALYEPALVSVLPVESEDGKAAREDRARFDGGAVAAAQSGDSVRAARLFLEGVFQLGPGGFERLAPAVQTRALDNARVMPFMLAAVQSATTTCGMLQGFTKPTLVMRGEKTQKYYALINEGVSKCLPNAQQVVLQNVNHNGPVRDPARFTAALLAFLAKGRGL
jgi:pimeloyl-ACP methyl ester carboxylesterase